MVALMLAVGCARSDAPPNGQQAIIPVVEVSDLELVSFPLDAYLLNLPDEARYLRAEAVLADRCMRRFNLRAPTLTIAENIVKDDANSRRYGVSDLAQVELDGYHTPDELIAPPVRKTPGTQSSASVSVFNGTGLVSYGGHQVPVGGCKGEADTALHNGVISTQNDRLAQQLVEQVSRQSRSAPQVLTVIGAWRDCMSKAGYNYQNPLSAANDPAFLAAHPTVTEVRTATADVECKRSVDLLSIWSSVEIANQRLAILANQAHLDGLAASKKNILANVSGILGP